MWEEGNGRREVGGGEWEEGSGRRGIVGGEWKERRKGVENKGGRISLAREGRGWARD